MTIRSSVRPYFEPAPLAALFLGISSGFAFSMIGERPSLMRSTLVRSGSTPMTSWPSFANRPADTAPTYPRPNTQIFIAEKDARSSLCAVPQRGRRL
jgi:hypothetical protein